MKSTIFLHSLHKKGVLQIVEPSKDLGNAYYEKAQKSLSSSKILLNAGNLEDSTALSYYAMYHVLQALFFLTGIKCENHKASILLLQEVYSQDIQSIQEAKKERIDKQYYTDFSITEKEVKEAIHAAETFIIRIKQILDTIQNADVKRYREILQTILRGSQ